MTRTKLPPTPASSTEIKGQDHSSKLSSLQMTFELPPSAITTGEAPQSSSSGTKVSPASPYLQPSETVKARRRSSTAQQQQKETFALPPPPTRSRKIIQMKPRPQEEKGEDVEGTPSPAKGSNAAKNAAGRATASKTTKKQPSATSAAGRKIARKTAHSLIERRRRSKMNEEFAVLKGLIPACTGEMHKLAILQASIEYVRYLEDCIVKLKAQHDRDSAAPTPTTEFRFTQRESYDDGDWNRQADEEVGPEDVEMTDSETPSPTFTNPPATRSNQSSISPALDAQTRHHSYSADHDRHYKFSTLPGTSPAAGPHSYPYPPGTASHSTPLTSPALRPQLEIDHEVSAALLMLGSDRRAAAGSKSDSARGMSVRDLLSS
ncbi:hypothetical protein HD806DRAFT_190583 [Xylariaceae sp. AK1471]|nr:hypothetical protein HD806DRAFT_190583 [Xylariaceae sp. AK1471]